MAESNSHKIRPYARLLTMLGEQLIKDERIALIEIIKNSYDADADWVKVTFSNFGPDYEKVEKSKIIIEDFGDGMDEEIILNHWLNPATPIKVHKKKEKAKTRKGRIIQGEKGIGRFALLKLGRKIKVITKVKNEKFEYVIDYDFSKYDDDFLSEDGVEKDLYLDDLSVSVYKREPKTIKEKRIILGTREITTPDHGTCIEISDLKGSWSENKIRLVYYDIKKLEPIFSDLSLGEKGPFKKGFDVWIYKDKEEARYYEDYKEKLGLLLENKAVIRIENGFFDSKKCKYFYTENNNPKSLDIFDPQIKGLKKIFSKFGESEENLESRINECGSFDFGFYIFDFRRNISPKYELDSNDKSIVRGHRIYLYRDGIRVYPYGEPDDDWLKIDQSRGTVSLGQFLSNDQVVGYINITQLGNPKLKDKTNREGLIEEGNATEDFITIIQLFLAFLRKGPYARYINDSQSKKEIEIFKSSQVQKEFEKLKDISQKDKKIYNALIATERLYKSEKIYLLHRAEISEELAGVGLSVETASHDIMGMMDRAQTNLIGLLNDISSNNSLDRNAIQSELQLLLGNLEFIKSQLKDIQLLFTSSKQKRKPIRIIDSIKKIERIYKRSLNKESIELMIESVGSPLMVKTTDAVILQLLLNLFDNSVYWLEQVDNNDKQILIYLDGKKKEMIFSDNGPGVTKDDAPYIFEPFYSGKGEEGRGLGLYIARQLLERYDYSIELAELKAQRLLSGANFVISFVGEESDGN